MTMRGLPKGIVGYSFRIGPLAVSVAFGWVQKPKRPLP